MALGRLGKRDGKAVADESETGTTTTSKPAKPASTRSGPSVAGVRTRIATVVWAVFVLLALVLAVGALLIAIGANRDNGLVQFVLDLADGVDLGVFSRENGIREFDGSNAETKNALFNWGLGAVAYLVIGRLLERVIKP
ncbi:hypothetical protein I601_3872 [Nocardioides dokdonensis FR1436]|uniref:Uncharacterized protein n=1 Tax=Nocardioides dokdonensis FR1436 TaxID=1300347 RepID=A0A1A9GRL2_9ACTN|nr:hypothetical protein [Nocardioides dokdonensis]ANH40270.1 hypothetical protein I601_3872 [Nocardioides dokdonensis FR1436]